MPSTGWTMPNKALYTAKHKGRNTISTALSRAVADNVSA
jgi:diguanylate cyclase